MDVHTSAFFAYSHLLIADVCPTVFASERFVDNNIKSPLLIVIQSFHLVVVVQDVVEFQATEWASRSTYPPINNAILAKFVLAWQLSDLFIKVAQADRAFLIESIRILVEHFLHSPGDPAIGKHLFFELSILPVVELQ